MSRLIRYVSVAAHAVILSSTPATAQTVQGIVLNEKSHHPIGRAQVALVDSTGRVLATTTSDSTEGAFYLSAPTRGEYRLRILVGHGGLAISPPLVVDSGGTVERALAVPDFPSAVLEAYLPQDVSIDAQIQRHPMGPRYPDRMRMQNRGGIVRTQFVVDRDGKADMSTFRVLQSDDVSFADSARRFIEACRFAPARLNDAAVAEVVDQAFDFDVNHGYEETPRRVEGKNVIVIRATGVIR